MKLKNKKLLFIVPVLSIGIFVGIRQYRNSNDINYILKNEYYSYLPVEAKDYIKEVYESTGKVLLTEKNKKENKLYLNPQYVEYLTLSDDDKETVGEIPISEVVDYTITNIDTSVDIPKSYDLRDKYITPVRDQGSMGLCWAFASAGSLESHLLKTTNNTYDENSTLISERQLDYITSKNGLLDYKSEYVSFINRSLSSGGNFYISTIAIANGVSAFNYDSFKPYDDTDFSKMELSDVINYSKSLYEVNSTINMPQINLRESTTILTDEENEIRDNYLDTIKLNIMANGASYVGTYMSNSCQYKDSSTSDVIIDVYNCRISNGHAMQIVGWDDDFEYKYCADNQTHSSNTSKCNNIVSGKGVWILKNSWGEETPFLYLTYDSLYSSVHFFDEVESTENKTWDNNYVLGSEETLKKETYRLTDTKIKDKEILKKLKFIAATSSTTYTVKVEGVNGTVKTYTKTNSLPGLITFEFSDNILIDKDSKITISSNGEYFDKVSIFTENDNNDYYIDTSNFDNLEISENSLRLYSETKNIESNTKLVYKVYDKNDNEVKDKITFDNTIVSENNVNTLINIDGSVDSATYKIKVFKDEEVISTFNIKYKKMEGRGTENDPYIITNSTQLSQIRNDLDAYYILGNDIDLQEDTREGGKLSNVRTCPEGFGWSAIEGFSGTLDGKGHTIKGLHQNQQLTCNDDGTVLHEWRNYGNGLFSIAEKNVTIKNLVLEDFDITCKSGECSALVSNYLHSYNSENGRTDYTDENEYTATFENIVLRNSKINKYYPNDYEKNGGSGGLFGRLESMTGNINIKNIYIDINSTSDGSVDNYGYLASGVDAKNVNISDIQLQGNLDASYSSNITGLIYTVADNQGKYNISINNVLSTIKSKKMSSLLIYQPQGAKVTNANILSVDNTTLCGKDCENLENVNIYDRSSELSKLTDKKTYDNWDDFDSNWVIKTVDGIPRLPVLKFVDFEYTYIPDIVINQELNKTDNIYNYIEPNIDSAKVITYKSLDEDILQIDEDGNFIPIKSGKTKIHVESYYDGYINDVNVDVNYVPHYTVSFDANGGNGEMDSIQINEGSNYILPANEFTRENYVFKEWNTKQDGTGESYSNLGELSSLKDKESITLYAIWIGEDRILYFDPNGGSVTPDKKMVKFADIYGDLPLPTKEGYGFVKWVTKADNPVGVEAFTSIINYNLEARWLNDAYTVLYNGNGGTVNSNVTSSYTLSSSLISKAIKNNVDYNLPDNYFTRKGYTFKEWNTKEDGTGDSYKPGDIINFSSVENSVFNLYAIWEKDQISITFDSNDDSNTTNVQTFDYTDKVKLNKNTFTRDGYIFGGWSTEKDGTGIIYQDEEEIAIDDNLVLYAIWIEDKTYVINKYSVDEDNKYIDLIDVGTTVDEFKENIYLATNFRVEVEYKEVDGKKLLYTGGKIKIYKDDQLYSEYLSIIRGDVNGNAIIDIIDYIRIMKDIMNTSKLSGVYYKAADVNQNGNIDIIDYIRIMKKIMEEK